MVPPSPTGRVNAGRPKRPCGLCGPHDPRRPRAVSMPGGPKRACRRAEDAAPAGSVSGRTGPATRDECRCSRARSAAVWCSWSVKGPTLFLPVAPGQTGSSVAQDQGLVPCFLPVSSVGAAFPGHSRRAGRGPGQQQSDKAITSHKVYYVNYHCYSLSASHLFYIIYLMRTTGSG